MITSMTVAALACIEVFMSANSWIDFADGLVTSFGKEFGNGENNPPVYHVVKTETGGNSPLNPPVISQTDVPVNAVFTSISRSMVDGTLIKQGDAGITVAKYSTEIEQGDTLKRDGKEYVVITKDPANPYGTSIVQKLIVRLR